VAKFTLENLKTLVDGAVKTAVAPLKEQQTNWAKTLVAPVSIKEPEEKGTKFARLVISLASSKGNTQQAAAYAHEKWKDDVVCKALTASIGAGGGFMVPDALSTEIIEFLRPVSVVRSLNPIVLPMPGGRLTMPGAATGSTASYVSEGVNAPRTEPTFRQISMTARKLAALVPISNDLLRFASSNVEQFVRDDVIAALAQRQDLAFIRGDGTGNTPKGFRFLAAPSAIIAANATVNVVNVTTDLAKLELSLLNNNIRMGRPGWITSPRVKMFLQNLRDANSNFVFPEVQLGLLRGKPIRDTTQVPINLGSGSDSELYLADFANVIIGDAEGIILDVSSEAAYFDGSAVVSPFSRDETVIRAIQQHDIEIRQDFAVAVLTGVTWA
jgi:HK97 family phage major capsid protein